MSARTYLCWIDKEDVTAAVNAERGAHPLPVIELNDEPGIYGATVAVKCSQGHLNVVVSEEAPRPPTGSERIWIGARDELTPTHSLTLADQKAQWIVALVGVFTALLAAFGIAGDPKLMVGHWAITAIPVSLVALSFAVIVYGATPAYALLDASDLRAVEAFFVKRLRRAGMTVRTGGILFALALFSIVPLYGYMASKLPAWTVRPVFRWSSGPTGPSVNIAVDIAGVRKGSSGNVEIRGVHDEGASDEILLKETFNAAIDGPAAVTIDIPKPERFRSFLLNVKLTGPDGSPGGSQQVEFRP